jgi:hypothetical protein
LSTGAAENDPKPTSSPASASVAWFKKVYRWFEIGLSISSLFRHLDDKYRI